MSEKLENFNAPCAQRLLKMTPTGNLTDATVLDAVDPDRHVLIAGPTASGKSDLALKIAEAQGGVIVNADASQVYDCWRVLTARPSPEDEARAAHRLYGHVSARSSYSAGHWLRDLSAELARADRLIIVGGTGLYFAALTRGLADIPETPTDVRAHADELELEHLLSQLDEPTRASIDTANRARVQRAWEVLTATGRGLADWQKDTGPPLLSVGNTTPIVFDVDKNWLNARIERRFDAMINNGALDEARALHADFDPTLPAHRAIGAPELMGYLDGRSSLDDAKHAATISTRQYAKRQRTWFRSKMGDWLRYAPLS